MPPPSRGTPASGGDRAHQRQHDHCTTFEYVPAFSVLYLDLQEYLFHEQALVTSACHVLVGVHGAGLINMVYMPGGGVSTVIELLPLGVSMDMYAVHARALGHRHLYWSNTELWRHHPNDVFASGPANHYGDTTEGDLDAIWLLVQDAIHNAHGMLAF